MKKNINEKRAENTIESGCSGQYIEQRAIDEIDDSDLYDTSCEDRLYRYNEKSPEEPERMLSQDESLDDDIEELMLQLPSVELDFDLDDIDVEDETNILQVKPHIILDDNSDDAIAEVVFDYIYEYEHEYGELSYVTTFSTYQLSDILNIDEEGIIRGIIYICENYRPISDFDVYFVDDIMTVINRKLYEDSI